jgi:molybdenum cofactor guanylyltransferase
MQPTAITGIVLAGGKSSRMGQDKGLMPYRGQMLVEYPLQILKAHCCEILISSNDVQYQQFGYQVVADVIKDCGPMGGIYSAMKQASNPYCLVVGCDMPFLNDEVVERLIGSINDESDIFVAAHQQNLEPLFAIYSHNCLESIYQALLSHQFQLYRFIRNSKTRMVNFSDIVEKQPNTFSNFNSPSDF